jgi:hypothetical protein
MYKCKPENAQQILEWINTRGGILLWDSANLSNPDQSWTTPALNQHGQPYTKPNWQAGKVIETITEVKNVVVVIPKVAKRFHVATRLGTQGLMVKVTDGGTRQIYRALAKYKDSWYEFDYGSHENVVIFVPDKTVPLTEFVAQEVPA